MKHSSRKAYVLAGYNTQFIGAKHPKFIHKKHVDYGKKENPILEDYIKESIIGVLKNANNLDGSLIDRAWIGNFAGELFSNQGHLGAAVVGSLPEKFINKPIMRVEGACASAGLAFISAV